MRSPLTRREFVKLCGLSLGTLAFHMPLDWTQDQPQSPLLKGRITTRSIYIYQEPDFKSDRVGTLSRDQIVNFYEEVSSPYGPAVQPALVPPGRRLCAQRLRAAGRKAPTSTNP